MRETIAAIASPPGIGAISVVRVSGERAWEIAKKLSGIEDPTPRKVYHAFLKDEKGEIDEVLLVFYKAPKSYTGEDMVEVFCHGGPVVTKMVLSAFLKEGARQAEPGEFTKRAFLSGKMDLTEAEAVRDLIEARAEESVRAYLRNLKGELHSFIEDVRKKLLEVLAEIEVEIDYPDEEDLEVRDLEEKLEKIVDEMEDILKRAEKSLEITKGIRVAIVGKPNVGKSTLLNRLLREDRAIVTPIPGTTRDTIEEDLNVRGRYFRVVDTAGLRKTEDPVESIGVKRSEREVQRADLVLHVVDDTLDEEDETIHERLSGKRVITVVNKIDKGKDVKIPWKGKIVRISALTGEGIDELEKAMIEMTDDIYEGMKGRVILTSRRQLELMKSALEDLKSALSSHRSGFPNDVVSLDIWKALSKLDEITGRSYKEDLLETIFSNFCVGK